MKEIEEMRSNLIRRTSHELKTPLISIYSTSQCLLNNFKEDLSEEILQFVETINRGGNRLKLLSQNLIDVYDIESKKIELKKKKIDMLEL